MGVLNIIERLGYLSSGLSVDSLENKTRHKEHLISVGEVIKNIANDLKECVSAHSINYECNNQIKGEELTKFLCEYLEVVENEIDHSFIHDYLEKTHNEKTH